MCNRRPEFHYVRDLVQRFRNKESKRIRSAAKYAFSGSELHRKQIDCVTIGYAV